MNPKPLLSVCIPTYNRAPFLRQCLSSITEQFNNPNVLDQVEVVVSDNASSDNTTAVVLEVQARFPQNVVYRKNEKNLGYDLNALSLADTARGEFIWLLGDDDALFPDALKFILEKIRAQKFEYCVVNYWGYNNRLEQPALKLPDATIPKDQYFSRLADFITAFPNRRGLVGFFCGLSVQVFKRQLWQDLPDKQRFIGSNAMHLYVLLTVMKGRAFAVFAKPLVKARADNIRWDSFSGLQNETARAASTQKVLIWILDFYGLPYSKFSLRLNFYKTVVKNWLRNFIRRYIFTSQKSRDFIKKLFGKL